MKRNLFNCEKTMEEFDHYRMPTTDEYTGRAFACIFPSADCKAGCRHCFFQSLFDGKKCECEPELRNLSAEGTKKAIALLNAARVSYLLVSGGGEPMENIESTRALVQSVLADKIVLVSSGYWAANTSKCIFVLDELYEAYQNRTTKTKLVLRLSVDEAHVANLGIEPIIRLLHLFVYSNKYAGIELQIHSLIGDTSVDDLAKIINAKLEIVGENVDEGSAVIKNCPYEKMLVFDNGVHIKVGYAKLFSPSLIKDINNPDELAAANAVYQLDMDNSEKDKPAVAKDAEGKKNGFDLWINNNGNISTWGTQNPAVIHNLYVDRYEIIQKDLTELVSFRSYLDHGNTYRDSIISEVDPKAVLRTTSSNVRDYAGSNMLLDQRTRVYWIVRSIQDYLADGTIGETDLNSLSPRARQFIYMDKKQLKALYKASSRDILMQTLQKGFDDPEAIRDTLLLIKLGHYEVKEENLRFALAHYNRLTGEEIKTLDEIVQDEDSAAQYRRMIDRLNRVPVRAYEHWEAHKKEDLI